MSSKILLKHCFHFLLGLQWSQEKIKTMLRKNFGDETTSIIFFFLNGLLLSKKQYQSNYSDQSQQEKTARWTNQNLSQLSLSSQNAGKIARTRCDFCYASHWLENWREIFKTITNKAVICNQSEFLAVIFVISKHGKNRTFKCDCLCFVSYWLKNWRKIFKPITKCSNHNREITLSSYLKTFLSLLNIRSLQCWRILAYRLSVLWPSYCFYQEKEI